MRTAVHIVMAFMLLIGLAACKNAKVYSVMGRDVIPSGSRSVNLEMVQEAIIKGGTGMGWQMDLLEPGHILAVIDQGERKAALDVYFDVTTFSISHHASQGFDYDGVHVNDDYNTLVKSVEQVVAASMATAGR